MKANILVVDDTPAALKLLDDLLSAEGYEVRPFNNGVLALRSAEAELPDLVLLDIRMPGMDGFETCRRLKENPKLRDLPVIFISAANELDDKVRGFQAGAVDFVNKPFQKEEVIARVNTHVALHRAHRELEATVAALHRSEESLKIAQSIAHLGHWEWELDTGTIRWSDEAYRILGYQPRDAALDQGALRQVIHPDDRQAVMEQILGTQDGHRFDIEHRIVLPDGAVRVVRSVGELVAVSGSKQVRLFGTIQTLPDPSRRELLGVIQDITERKEMERKLEAEARTDALTGAATRRHFLELARLEVARVRRYAGALSLLMLDVDHFKQVNDQHGHLIGDLALKTLVQACVRTLRQEDVIGRLGGEEFAILLRETDAANAFEAAERLRLAIEAAVVPAGLVPELQITSSIGVVTLGPGDADVEALLDRADKALYAAKKAGRNTVRVAGGEPADTTAGG